jgi:hypothetical protein
VRNYAFLSLALALALLTCACSTSVTSLQTGRALAPGEVQLTAAASLPLSTSAINGVLDSLDRLEGELEEAATSEDNTIDAETQRQLTESALALLLFQPAPVMEINGRMGLVPKLDAGLRYSARQVKGDLKYQFWDGENGHAAGFTLGYSYHLSIAPSILESAFDLLEYVELNDFSRHDLDLGLIWSRDWGEWLSLYGGLRYLVSFISLDADLQKVESSLDLERTSLSSRLHMVGVTGGAMLGYKHLFLHLELSVLSAEYAPTILGDKVDLSGTVISPAFGLTTRF